MSAICWAVMVAAGQGSRMGLSYNKALMPLMGKPMLKLTLETLIKSGLYAGVVVVVSAGDRERVSALIKGEERVKLAEGGATRQQSVLSGLRALPEDCEYVAVHDAARPFVTPAILKATLDSAIEYGSGVACTAVTDTIKQVDAQGRVHTLNRDELRAVQTPQVFRRDTLLRAHEWARREGIEATDDSALVELSGGDVRLVRVPDGGMNVKVTTPADLRLVAPRPRVGAQRTGLGYDAHRLVEGRALVLCGVEVPFEKGLLGHSDADVATHALIDALLGAAGMGDIGRMFPDTDERYKDIRSIELLREAVRRIRTAGMIPTGCDITIVAQRPKLAPYVEAMRTVLAGALGMPRHRVNIKGKTTEGLGFEGEGLGISAQCVATVEDHDTASPR